MVSIPYVLIDTDDYDRLDQRIATQLGYEELVRDDDAVLVAVPEGG